MSKLEKLLFLEIKSKEDARLPEAEYFKLYNSLTEKHKEEFGKLKVEINQIFNRLNTNQCFWSDGKTINSVKDYNLEISSVSAIILKVNNQYGLKFKKEITPEFLSAYKATLGYKSLNRFLKGINCQTVN